MANIAQDKAECNISHLCLVLYFLYSTGGNDLTITHIYIYTYIYIYQGHRKQFFSGQANQLQIYLDIGFRMIIIVRISMGSMLMLGDLMACPPERFLKNRCFEIEFEGISGS